MEYRTVQTTCTYCGCGCGLLLGVMDEEVVGTLPLKTHPINEGTLCIKGWSVHEFVQNEKRLQRPLVREKGDFQEVDWEDALGLVASRLRKIRDEFGPDSIAGLSSAKCTNEENYLFQKWMRAVVGTNNVDHCARLCHSSTVAGLAAAFGSGAMTNSTPEIEDADCILITGSNTSESHPLVANRVFRAREKGAKLVVVDPRRMQMARVADIHVRNRPGSDVAWINGIMHIIIKEGWEDKEFVAQRTEGFEALKKEVEAYPPERVAEISGISPENLRRIAETYAKAEKASILFAMGITQHTTGVDNVKSLANLAMLTGNLGRPSTGINPLRGQNNVQGACDVGALPNVYPGYQSVTDEVVAKKFEEAWGVKLDRKVGLTIPEMFSAIEEERIKAMVILGENPLLSDPDVNHVEKAIRKLDFLVVQDMFMTETARLAQVVLPGVSFAEKDGTFTATDRRVQRVRKAIDPLGEARPDWEILCDLARKMGGEGFAFSAPKEIFDELAKVTPIYQGICFERIETEGLQWPCRSPEDPGTPYLHKDQITKGRGTFHAISYREPAELPDEQFPFVLTTGRMGFHFHTGTMTRISPSLHKEAESAYMEIHPEDAQKLGIHECEEVRVSSRRGTIDIKASLTEGIDRGVVFIPFHFVESAANRLTNNAFDPIAKIPEYKVCAVRIEKLATNSKEENDKKRAKD